MNVGWGKAVKIINTSPTTLPSNSVGKDFRYCLSEISEGFSGCSFSTSYVNNSIKASGLGGSVVNTDDNFHIKVMMPSTFLQRKLIDLLASFVAVDGEAFECELMAKESHNEEDLLEKMTMAWSNLNKVGTILANFGKVTFATLRKLA